MSVWADILVKAIEVGIPALVTIITTRNIKRQANKHACRQSILQLILEDKVSVHEGKIPENYKSIMDEYDEYKQCYGNHYIDGKIEEYKKWYNKITEELANGRES